MEEMRVSAVDYYEKLSKEDKQPIENAFQKLDIYRDGKIGIQVYKATLEQGKHMKQLTGSRFFTKLDQNKDGFLDKQDIITLFYLIKSERLRFCDNCDEFLIGRFFPCSQCLDSPTEGSSYKLCGSCYGTGEFSHHHENDKFVANDLLQKQKKSESGNSVQPKKNSVDRKQHFVREVATATAASFIARGLMVGTQAAYNHFKAPADSDAATNHVPDPSVGAASSLFGSSVPDPSVDPSAGAASALFGSPVPNPSADPSGAASALFGSAVPDPSADPSAGAASALFGSPVPDPSAGATSSLFGSPVPDPSAGAASSLFCSPIPDPSAGAAYTFFGSHISDPSAGAASSLFGSPVSDPSAGAAQLSLVVLFLIHLQAPLLVYLVVPFTIHLQAPLLLSLVVRMLLISSVVLLLIMFPIHLMA